MGTNKKSKGGADESKKLIKKEEEVDLPKKFDIASGEIRGDKDLAEAEMNPEGKKLWHPTEEDEAMIAAMLKEWPKLDYEMASTLFMFCKNQPEKAEKMVKEGDDYKWEHHKDEYYQQIKDGQQFIGDEYCTVEHNFIDPNKRKVLNIETGEYIDVGADMGDMHQFTLGELMDYKAEQERQDGITIVEKICEEEVEEKLKSSIIV